MQERERLQRALNDFKALESQLAENIELIGMGEEEGDEESEEDEEEWF